MRKVIVNSTPLIALCHVNQLNVLKQLYGEIMIPKAVYDEISVKEDSVCKKYAKYLELPVTGTLGVLMKAKQKGYLSELKPVLDVMVQNGIYIKSSLVELCLKQVGEA